MYVGDPGDGGASRGPADDHERIDDMTDDTPTLTIDALGSIAWHLSYRAVAAECGDL